MNDLLFPLASLLIGLVAVIIAFVLAFRRKWWRLASVSALAVLLITSGTRFIANKIMASTVTDSITVAVTEKAKVDIPFSIRVDPATHQPVADVRLGELQKQFPKLVQPYLPTNSNSEIHHFDFSTKASNGNAIVGFRDNVTKRAWGKWPWGGTWSTNKGKAVVDVAFNIEPYVVPGDDLLLPSLRTSESHSSKGANDWSKFCDSTGLVNIRKEVDKAMRKALAALSKVEAQANKALDETQGKDFPVPITWFASKGGLRCESASFIEERGELVLRIRYAAPIFKTLAYVL